MYRSKPSLPGMSDVALIVPADVKDSTAISGRNPGHSLPRAPRFLFKVPGSARSGACSFMVLCVQ